MAFNLLTNLGLRGKHRLLDVGCGSLRIGRLLIPYLDAGNYTGVEPNVDIFEAGLEAELGRDIVRVKRPSFHMADNAAVLPTDARYDYVLAQSIFSHTSRGLMQGWLDGVSQRLAPGGVLAATYIRGEKDYAGDAWWYPGPVTFRFETLQACGQEAGLRCVPLEWRHPHGQTWLLFVRAEAAIPEGMVEYVSSS
jgi:SAM-dependent methyltransferase